MGLVRLDNNPRMNDVKISSVTKGVSNFGIHLLKNGVHCLQNGIIAIHSIASVLGMTLLGADGNTATEIMTALNNTDSPSTTDNNDVHMSDEDDVDGTLVLQSAPPTRFEAYSLSQFDEENGIDLHPTVTVSPKKSSLTSSLKKMKRMMSRSNSKDIPVKDLDFHRILTSMCINTDDNPQTTYDGYILRNANRLYIKKGGSISKGFIQNCEAIYKSKPEIENFASNPEKCRHEINSWVEKQTQSKIRDLLPSGSISNSTSIVIVNAIYFKGDWENKFDPFYTAPKPFHTISGAEKITDFMFKNDPFIHKFDPVYKCQVLEMPYVKRDLSFFVILPNDNTEFAKLQPSLNPEILQQLTRGLNEEEVIVYLPKFKIEVTVDLSSVLMNLGINDLFTPGKANLTGIDSKAELYVSGVMHKAFIEVNEEGAEAAGATAEVVRAAGGPIPKRTVFKADHPFFFMIRDNRTDAILFLGQYCEP